MARQELEKIAKYTIESGSSMQTQAFPRYMNGLDLADTVIKEKPTALLMHADEKDAELTAGFTNREFPKLGMGILKNDVIVSYDKLKVRDLSEELSKPQKERDHYRVGKILGYPDSAARAFADPTYNIAFLTFDDIYRGKKFDEALFFAGHDWASIDDEESLSMGKRRANMFLGMFGESAYDEFVNTYRQHLIDFNPILEEEIPARPGYVKPNLWG